MKREHEFDKISGETGFNPDQIEKVCRISDILEGVSQVPFMRDRLALYGGTALAFVHFEAIERLSVDIDFNYRHIDEEDWGDVRDRIDDNMKTILYSLGYTDRDITINSSYPLNRFTVKYINHLGRNDDIRIETGYMRRIPILKNDRLYDFYHVGTHRKFKIMTPAEEELFSNKWCTMLYRGSPRDLFDVYRIAGASFDEALFRGAAVVDSLFRGLPSLIDINYEEKIRGIRFDSSLLNVLYSGNVFDEELVHEAVIDFTKGVLDDLSFDEIRLIETFYQEYKLDEQVVSKFTGLHSELSNHPLIKWQIKELSNL
jgi:predicted nucleotidyltransferase component of viral defense system